MDFLKRGVDVLGAVAGLIVLAPVLAVVAVVILMRMGRPVLFHQTRPGLNERPFAILKFRTMANPPVRSGPPLSDAERLTPLGRFLRASSIDELPELWNVLRGDMSLVGPRPLLMKYLPLYSPEQRRRHLVRPGVTGWAQVNGRNAITWDRKFELDVWYVDHASLALDLEILWLTVFKVFTRHGVSPDDQAIMPEFRGTTNEPSSEPGVS